VDHPRPTSSPPPPPGAPWWRAHDLGRSRYERCTFLNCRWQGAFTYEADLVDCTFVGKIDGAVWGGDGTDVLGRPGAPNEIRGNDFTAVRFGDNVGWRHAFPLDDQRWPEGYVPVPDL